MKQLVGAIVLLLLITFAIFGQKSVDECPKYEIKEPSFIAKQNEYLIFELIGDENFQGKKLSFNWRISNGEIYAGQGTKVLIVFSKIVGSTVDVTATVQGLPAQCQNTSTVSTGAIDPPRPILVDESGKAEIPGNLKAGLDNYFVQLNNDPTAEGIIVFESKTKSAVVEQINKISRAVFFRRYDLSRISYRIVVNKDKENTAYWLVPSGAVFPPTENAITINASEYENIRKFFTINQQTRKK